MTDKAPKSSLQILDQKGNEAAFDPDRFAIWLGKNWHLNEAAAHDLARETERRVSRSAQGRIVHGRVLAETASRVISDSPLLRSALFGSSTRAGISPVDVVGPAFEGAKALYELLKDQGWQPDGDGYWKKENSEAWFFRDTNAPNIVAEPEVVSCCTTLEGGKGIAVPIKVTADDKKGSIHDGITEIEVCWVFDRPSGKAAVRCKKVTLTDEEHEKSSDGDETQKTITICVPCEAITNPLIFTARATDGAGNGRIVAIPVVVPTDKRSECC